MKRSILPLSPRDSTIQLSLTNHQTKNHQRMDAETNQHPRDAYWEDEDTLGGAGGTACLRLT